MSQFNQSASSNTNNSNLPLSSGALDQKLNHLENNYSRIENDYLNQIKLLKAKLHQRNKKQAELGQEVLNLKNQYLLHQQEINQLSQELSSEPQVKPTQRPIKKSSSPRLLKKSLQCNKKTVESHEFKNYQPKLELPFEEKIVQKLLIQCKPEKIKTQNNSSNSFTVNKQQGQIQAIPKNKEVKPTENQISSRKYQIHRPKAAINRQKESDQSPPIRVKKNYSPLFKKCKIDFLQDMKVLAKSPIQKKGSPNKMSPEAKVMQSKKQVSKGIIEISRDGKDEKGKLGSLKEQFECF